MAAGIWTGTHWSSVAQSLGGQASAAGAADSISATVTTVPGTAEDPVVTKSYVDQRLAELGSGTGGSTGGTTAPGNGGNAGTGGNTGNTGGGTSGSGAGGSAGSGSGAAGGNSNPPGGTDTTADGVSIKIINVPVGKTLIAGDGAEVVVRAGKALAYSSDSNGISDVTDGIDIKSGASVPNNHLISVSARRQGSELRRRYEDGAYGYDQRQLRN